MTEPLPAERFAALAQAHGGDLARWPAAERAAAAATLARDPQAAALLAEATALDRLLDRWQVPGPGAALVGAILARAPATAAATWTRARLWWSGLGLAGVGLGGALAGALVASMTPPPLGEPHGYADEGTSLFGDLAPAQAAL